MKLAHLTDLHIAEADGPEAHHTGLIVDDLVERVKPDVVAISGDIVDTPRAEYFDTAEELLRPIVEDCILLLVTRGNHDGEWLGTLGFVDWSPWRAFCRSLTKVDYQYPYAMNVDGVQLVLIDTTARAGGLEDLACGRVGRSQRLLLAKTLQLGDAHTRVTIGHHNLFEDDPTLLLADAELVRATIAGPVGLHLQGHDHRWGIWRDVDGIGWLADGGKSTQPHQGILRYRLFDITEEGIDYTTETIEVQQ